MSSIRSNRSFDPFIRGSFLLHLIPKDPFDHLRVGFIPTTKVFNRERHLDMSKILIRLTETIVRARIEMKLDERLLRLVAPQVLHESIDHRPLCCRHILIDYYCRMLAE